MPRSIAFLILVPVLMLASCVRATPFQIGEGCPQFPPKGTEQGGGPMASTTMGEPVRHAAPTRHVAMPQGAIESVSIVLERTGCFGTCPSYRVEVRGNGEVRFRGDSYVNFAGEHRTHIPQAAVRCLLDDFRFADFWSLDSKYEAPATDLPTYTMSVTIGGNTKAVTDYAGQMVGMPASVSGLENAIDQAAQTEMWIKGNAQTIAALEAEKFDFHGRAAADLLAMSAQDAPDALVNGLLDRGAPMDGRTSPNMSGETFSTVEVAAREGRLALLKRLIEAGAFRQGGKAIVSAALRASVGSSRTAVVAEVLKYQPDINGTDEHGDTALALIFTGAHPGRSDSVPDEDAAIAQLLGKAGARPDLPNSEHGSLLGHAFTDEKIAALVAIGADLEKRDASGDTPLLAVADEDTALALMRAGANPLARNRAGQTFAEIARENKWSRAVAAIDARMRK